MGNSEERKKKVVLFASHAQEREALLARGEPRGMSHNTRRCEDIHTH